MDISTATRNLRPLLAAGYITMRAGSRDGRRREIWLTAKGTRALDRACVLWAKAQSDVVAELGERRSKQLLALLAPLR